MKTHGHGGQPEPFQRFSRNFWRRQWRPFTRTLKTCNWRNWLIADGNDPLYIDMQMNTMDNNSSAPLSTWIEGVCSRLFDDWCERRAVVPLCYLMSAWPLTYRSQDQLCRLYCAMRELLKNEYENLLEYERNALEQIVSELSPVLHA